MVNHKQRNFLLNYQYLEKFTSTQWITTSTLDKEMFAIIKFSLISLFDFIFPRKWKICVGLFIQNPKFANINYRKHYLV